MANKEQRRLNAYIKRFNKSLAEDALLGLNRFKIYQLGKHRYDDLWVHTIQLVDHKTDETHEFNLFYSRYTSNFFWEVNNFIIRIRQKENW